MDSVDVHERHRLMVCIVCYKKLANAKLIQKVKGKVSRTLTDAQIDYISNNIIKGYTIDNPCFPSGICVNCSIVLNKCIKNGPHVALLPDVDYDPGVIGLLLRGKECDCRICKIASTSGFTCRIGKKSKIVVVEKRPEHIVICSKCFSKIGKGLPHDCSKRGKVTNIQDLLSQTPTSSQRFASRVVSEEISASISAKSSTTPVLSSLNGKPRSLDCKKQIKFSVEDLSNMQVDVGLSSKQTLKVAEHLRNKPGKKGKTITNRTIVESNLKRKLKDKNRQLGDLFEVRRANFVKEDKDKRENFKRDVVVCKDLNGLADRIIEKRNMKEDHLLFRVGMDGGGGFMKVILNVFDLREDGISPEDENQPKMMRRLDETFKDSSVKKSMIVAIAPEVQENYCNIKRLWLEAGLGAFSRQFVIATDLKLINILLGLMSHSSVHPCSWCDVVKENLEWCGKSRTVGNMLDLFWGYFDARALKKDASLYGNVIHPNMFSGCGEIDESTTIISLVPPPELHLLLGPVNKMFDEMLKIWPGAEEWSDKLFLKRAEYHGLQFDGNSSRKLLKNVALLKEIAPSTNKKVFDYVHAFEAFNEVVKACYSRKLAPNYMQKITDFRTAYKKLSISITPKIHAIFHHISEFCEIVKMGLGPYSEQAAESVHHDFNTMWSRFKVKTKEHPEYGQRLLKSVIMYNSQHF